MLFLLAAACLPDKPERDCDLRAFYDGNRRYFWWLFATYQAIYVGLYVAIGGSMTTAGQSTPFDWARVLVPLAAYALLAWRRERWLHIALPATISIVYVVIYWRQTLG